NSAWICAAKHNSPTIEVEHLLFGIVEALGDGAPLWKALNVNAISLRRRIDRCLLLSDSEPTPRMEWLFSGDVRRVLRRTPRETSGPRGSAGPEHLLLALVREDVGIAAVVLEECGIGGVQQVRQA